MAEGVIEFPQINIYFKGFSGAAGAYTKSVYPRATNEKVGVHKCPSLIHHIGVMGISFATPLALKLAIYAGKRRMIAWDFKEGEGKLILPISRNPVIILPAGEDLILAVEEGYLENVLLYVAEFETFNLA